MPDRASVIRLLRNPDPAERQLAFEAIAGVLNDALVEEILAIAEGDESEEIRADAIIALGPTVEECGIDYDDEFELPPEFLPAVSREAFEELRTRLRAIHDDATQPTIVRRRALEVLVRDPQPWHSDAIRRPFAAADRDWKLTAIFAMGYVRGFEKEVLALLQDAEGDFLFEAVRAAAELGLEEGGGRIAELAESPETDPEVRLVAIEALPWVAPASRDLLEDLSSDDDEEIAAAAEDALDELDARAMAEGGEVDDELDDDE